MIKMVVMCLWYPRYASLKLFVMAAASVASGLPP